jgi:ABC-type dipeptide/oligopeptide/nickel transport system permease component
VIMTMLTDFVYAWLDPRVIVTSTG